MKDPTIRDENFERQIDVVLDHLSEHRAMAAVVRELRAERDALRARLGVDTGD